MCASVVLFRHGLARTRKQRQNGKKALNIRLFIPFFRRIGFTQVPFPLVDAGRTLSRLAVSASLSDLSPLVEPRKRRPFRSATGRLLYSSPEVKYEVFTTKKLFTTNTKYSPRSIHHEIRIATLFTTKKLGEIRSTY